MRERARRPSVLRTGRPVTVGSVTLLPIERVVTRMGCDERRAWFSATKEPRALIVRDVGGLRAIAIDAPSVSLESLRDEVPELDAVLAAL